MAAPTRKQCSRACNVLFAILTNFCRTRSVEYIILVDVYVCKCCYNDIYTFCRMYEAQHMACVVLTRAKQQTPVFLCFFHPKYILTTYLLKYTFKIIYVQNDINIKIYNLGNRLHKQRIKGPNK